MDEQLHEIADELFIKMKLFPSEQRNAYIMGFIDGSLREAFKKQHMEIVVTTGPLSSTSNPEGSKGEGE